VTLKGRLLAEGTVLMQHLPCYVDVNSTCIFFVAAKCKSGFVWRRKKCIKKRKCSNNSTHIETLSEMKHSEESTFHPPVSPLLNYYYIS
jgi:hypothetical protein